MINTNFLAEFARATTNTVGNFAKTVSEVATNPAVQGYGMAAGGVGTLLSILSTMKKKDAEYEVKSLNARLSGITGLSGKTGAEIRSIVNRVGRVSAYENAMLSLSSKIALSVSNIADHIYQVESNSDKHYTDNKDERSFGEKFVSANAKYNPVFQLLSFIQSGRSPLSLQKEFGSEKRESIYEEASHTLRMTGVGFPGLSALKKDSREILNKGNTIQEKQLHILSWMGDLTRQSTMFLGNIQQFLGVSSHLSFGVDIPKNDTIFGKIANIPKALSDLPVFNAIKNIIKGGIDIIKIPQKIVSFTMHTYEDISRGVRNFFSGGLFRLKSLQDVEKKAGLKSVSERSQTFIADVFPDFLNRAEHQRTVMIKILDLILEVQEKSSNLKVDRKDLNKLKSGKGLKYWDKFNQQITDDSDVYVKVIADTLEQEYRKSFVGSISNFFRNIGNSNLSAAKARKKDINAVLKKYGKQVGGNAINYIRSGEKRVAGIRSTTNIGFGLRNEGDFSAQEDNLTGRQETKRMKYLSIPTIATVGGGALSAAFTGGLLIPAAVTAIIGALSGGIAARKYNKFVDETVDEIIGEKIKEQKGYTRGIYNPLKDMLKKSSTEEPPTPFPVVPPNTPFPALGAYAQKTPIGFQVIFGALNIIENKLIDIYKLLKESLDNLLKPFHDASIKKLESIELQNNNQTILLTEIRDALINPNWKLSRKKMKNVEYADDYIITAAAAGGGFVDDYAKVIKKVGRPGANISVDNIPVMLNKNEFVISDKITEVFTTYLPKLQKLDNIKDILSTNKEKERLDTLKSDTRWDKLLSIVNNVQDIFKLRLMPKIQDFWEYFKFKKKDKKLEKKDDDGGSFLGSLFTGIGTLLGLSAGKGVIKNTGELLFKKIIKPIFGFFPNIFKKLFSGEGFLSKIFSPIKNVFSKIFSGEGFLSKIFSPIKNLFSKLFSGEGFLSKIFSPIKSIFEKVFSGGFSSKIFGGIFKKLPFVKILGGIFKKLPFVNLLFAAYDAYSGYTNAAEITGVQNPNFLQKIGAGVAGVVSGITFGLLEPKTIYGWMSKGLSLVSEKISGIKDWFFNLGPIKSITEFLSKINSEKEESGESWFSFIWTKFKSIASNTIDFISDVPVIGVPFKLIRDAYHYLFDDRPNDEPSIISTIWTKFNSIASNTIDFISKVPIFGAPIRILRDAYNYLFDDKNPEQEQKSFFEKMIEGIKSLTVDDMLRKLLGPAYSSVKNIYDKVMGSDIAKNIKEKVSSTFDAVKQPVQESIDKVKDLYHGSFVEKGINKISEYFSSNDKLNFSMSEDTIKAIKSMIIDNEGVRYRPYRDSNGYSVGVGHFLGSGSLKPEDDRVYSKAEIYSMFEKDFIKHANAASKIPGFNKLNDNGKAALIDLTYNMGPTWWYKFKHFTKDMETGNFENAVESLKDSDWYRKGRSRAKKTLSLFAKGFGSNNIDNLLASQKSFDKLTSGLTLASAQQEAINKNSNKATVVDRDQTGNNNYTVPEKEEPAKEDVIPTATPQQLLSLSQPNTQQTPIQPVSVMPESQKQPIYDVYTDEEIERYIGGIFAAIPRYLESALNEFTFTNKMNLAMV